MNLLIKQLLDACGTLTQAELAGKSGVSRPALNTWLNKGTGLGDARVAAIVLRLLEWIEEKRPDLKTSHATLISEIDSRSSIALHVNKDDYFAHRPVPPEHHTYTERKRNEDQLVHICGYTPVKVAIIGGSKLGKTSLLGWMRRYLQKKYGYVVCCDFRNTDYDSALEAIDSAVRNTLRKDTRQLRAWDEFPVWIQRALPLEGQICTLILDHLHDLEDGQLREFQNGLHRFINATAEHVILGKLNLLISYDEALLAQRLKQDYSSGLQRDFSPHHVPLFDEVEIGRLINAVTAQSWGSILDRLVAFAWERFQGHPYLTHVWAESVSLQKGTFDLEKALEETVERAIANLITPLLSTLLRKEPKGISELRTYLTSDQSTIQAQAFTEFACLWLVSSGLFERSGIGNQSSLYCKSAWSRQQLALTLHELDPQG